MSDSFHEVAKAVFAQSASTTTLSAVARFAPQVLVDLVDARVITINEAREALGLEAYPADHAIYSKPTIYGIAESR